MVDKLADFAFYGYPGHFWFFPAIIIATFTATLFYKLKLLRFLLPLSLVLYVMGCLGCAYYEIGIKIPLLSAMIQSAHFITIRRFFLMGIPFFCAGTIRLEKLSTKCIHLLFLLSAVVFVAEIYLVTFLNLSENIYLTFGLYFLLIFTTALLFRHPLPQYTKSAAAARSIANFTYYAHPFFLQSIPMVGAFLGFEISFLLAFFVTIVVTFVLGALFHALAKREKFRIIQYFIG